MISIFSYYHEAMLMFYLNLYNSVQIPTYDIHEQITYARSKQPRKIS